MSKEKPDKLFDARTLERNLKKGLIDKKDFQKHMDSLEDSKDLSEQIVLEDTEENGETMPSVEDYKD